MGDRRQLLPDPATLLFVALAIAIGCGRPAATATPRGAPGDAPTQAPLGGSAPGAAEMDDGYGPRELAMIGAEWNWTDGEPIVTAKLSPDVFAEFPAVDRGGKVLAIVDSGTPGLADYEVEEIRFVSLVTHVAIASYVVFDASTDLAPETATRAARERDRAAAQALLDRTTWRTLERAVPRDELSKDSGFGTLDAARTDADPAPQFARFEEAGLDLEMTLDEETHSPLELVSRRLREGRLEAARFPVGSLPSYGKWEDGSECGFATGMDMAWITPDRAHALLALRFSVGGDACVGGADIDGLAVVDLPSTPD